MPKNPLESRLPKPLTPEQESRELERIQAEELRKARAALSPANQQEEV